MHCTTLPNLVLALILAHLGVVLGSPAGPLQRSQECDFICQTDAQCGDCPGAVDPVLQYTCVTLDIPGLDGVNTSIGSQEDGPAYPALLGLSAVVGPPRQCDAR